MKVNTKYGEMEESQLERKIGFSSGALVVEYYRNGELVHRSASTSMIGVEAVGVTQGFTR